MFEIKHIQERTKGCDYLEIKNLELSVHGIINLNQGASLVDLTLNNKRLISAEGLEYKTHYNSAILFPFVNRLKNGQYTFENQAYQLPLNKPEEGNSIHGLVYNKTFEVFETKSDLDSLAITLHFKDDYGIEGFPFKYSMYLTYKFCQDSLSLNVKVINNDEKSFPFSLGWHPYFMVEEKNEAEVIINGYSEMEFDSNLNIKLKEIQHSNIKISTKDLDNCYKLYSKELIFRNSNYAFKMLFEDEDNFLQLYTPKNLNIIAIEPQTGIANCFNNEIGQQILKTNESYQKGWKLKLTQTN